MFEMTAKELVGRHVSIQDLNGVGIVISVDVVGNDYRALVWFPNPACCHNPRIVETSVKSIKLAP